MCYPSRLFVPMLCLFACLALTSPIWAGAPKNGAPQYAFVSTGTGGQIYRVDVNPTSATYGAAILLVNTPGADYEGLVVGPNPAATSVNGVPTDTVLVYACDATDTNNSGLGKIVRFDPAASPITLETIYAGGAGLQHPQCGRITSTYDLIVTDTGTGSGWWVFPGIASTSLTGTSLNLQTPSSLTAQPGTLEGTALKNSGDLLVVDNKGDQILKSPQPSFTGSVQFASTGLSNPFGIARRSNGQIYVSNQTNNPYIAEFDAGTTVPALSSCASVSVSHAKTIAAMQMSPNDTLYVAGSAGAKGALFSLNASAANGCLASQTLITSSLPVPAIGVALELPDFSSAAQTLTTSGGTGRVSFNYAAFEVDDAVGACSLNVLAHPVPPAFLATSVSPLIQSHLLPPPPAYLALGTTATPDAGWDGFVTVVQNMGDLSTLPNCLGPDGFFHFLMATQALQSLVQSPQLVSCGDDYSGCAVDTEGVFPLSQILPGDWSSTGTKLTPSKCQFFLVDSGTPAAADKGTFCGFGSPLNNASTPSQGANVTLGAVPVKFRLADFGSSCSGTSASNFIGDAVALLSIEQIADANGNAVQVPIQISASGGSSPVEPIFNVDGNKNYTFSLQLNSCTLPSGSTGPCPFGTYALTVTLLTNNTAGTGQSIYGALTTYFNLIP